MVVTRQLEILKDNLKLQDQTRLYVAMKTTEINIVDFYGQRYFQ